VVDPENAAGLLGKCRVSDGHCNQQRARSRKAREVFASFRVPPFVYREAPGPFSVGSSAWINTIFATLAQRQAGALVVSADPFFEGAGADRLLPDLCAAGRRQMA
jgi:hypothetical protein